MLNKLLQSLFKKNEVAASSESQFKPLDKAKYEKYNKFRPEGKKELFCYVPFTNMTFSFKGRTLACAYNQKVELGRYPNQSIREMWFESEMGNNLRDHMEHNDLNYGCKHCKYFVDNEKFSGLKPLVFDKYADNKRGKFPRVLEFELSSTCNFECVMCNGEVSSSIRKNRDKLPPLKSPYDEVFVEQLVEFIPHIKEAKFYGGEPFLIDIYFKIWDKILELNPSTTMFIITNGSVLNQRIKDLLERGDFDIGVSMDSINKKVIESIRLNVKHERLHENIQYYNDYCKRKKKNLVISFTMMRINWEEFVDVIKFCNRIDAILYVSYLKTPPKFAIWNLPSTTLNDMLQQLQSIEFPKGSFVEKSNARCFSDFLSYLQSCAENNKTRSSKEILPFSKQPPIVNTQLTVTKELEDDYDSSNDYCRLVTEELEKQLGESKDATERIQSFLQKIEQTKSLVNPTISYNKVFYTILKTPLLEVLRDVEKFSLEQLAENINANVRS